MDILVNSTLGGAFIPMDCFFGCELCQGNYLEFPALPKRIKNESMMSHTSIFHSKKQYHHTSRMQHPPSKHHALLRVNHYKVKSICICLISPIWVPLNDPWFPPLPHRWHNPQAFIVTIMLQDEAPLAADLIITQLELGHGNRLEEKRKKEANRKSIKPGEKWTPGGPRRLK